MLEYNLPVYFSQFGGYVVKCTSHYDLENAVRVQEALQNSRERPPSQTRFNFGNIQILMQILQFVPIFIQHGGKDTPARPVLQIKYPFILFLNTIIHTQH